MKLKVKMAEEYGGKPKYIGDIEVEISNDAFIAGFEKAREMSTEIVSNSIATGTDKKQIKKGIENLGEEEA